MLELERISHSKSNKSQQQIRSCCLFLHNNLKSETLYQYGCLKDPNLRTLCISFPSLRKKYLASCDLKFIGVDLMYCWVIFDTGWFFSTLSRVLNICSLKKRWKWICILTDQGLSLGFKYYELISLKIWGNFGLK